METIITSQLAHAELKESFYAYVYFESPQKPFYVGKGCKNRANTHVRGSHNKALQSRIRNLKVKGVTPTLKIIHVDSETEAFELESFLIKEIGRLDRGTGPLFNFTDGGDGGHSGYETPQEVKDKIRASLVGRKYSDERRANMSASKKGKARSPKEMEVLHKMSEKNKGKPCSEETRAKIGAANAIACKGRIPWNKGLKKCSR